jgi:hypothetical protein
MQGRLHIIWLLDHPAQQTKKQGLQQAVQYSQPDQPSPCEHIIVSKNVAENNWHCDIPLQLL